MTEKKENRLAYQDNISFSKNFRVPKDKKTKTQRTCIRVLIWRKQNKTKHKTLNMHGSNFSSPSASQN